MFLLSQNYELGLLTKFQIESAEKSALIAI